MPPSIAKSAGIFLGMVGGTCLSGLVVGLIAALIGIAIFRSDPAGLARIGGAVIGGVVGYTAGIIVGMVLARKIFHYGGSLWMGALGAIIGGIAVVSLADPLSLNHSPTRLVTSLLLTPALLGTIGFHIKIWKRPH
ncbi:hypothetical protein ACFLU4_08665 [Chloroflexota bacterium]